MIAVNTECKYLCIIFDKSLKSKIQELENMIFGNQTIICLFHAFLFK